MAVRGVRQPMAGGTVIARLGNTQGAPDAVSLKDLGKALAAVGGALSAQLDAQFGGAQGDVLYRDATVWKALAPGTLGQFLQTQGAGANPKWADGMTIKSIQRGTITLAAVGSNTATITSVDTTKSELRLLGFTFSAADAPQSVRLALTNATTITATKLPSLGTAVVEYEITEWA